MDGALSSSRYDGGGGGGRHDGGGGGRRPYRGGYRGGGGGGRRHHPYNNNRRRGPRPPGNRYSGAAAQTKSVDPQTAMMQQLSAMVSRVGELKTNSQENSSTAMRPAVAAVSKNIIDLSAVLCNKGNAALFLKFDNPNNDAKQEAGHLAHLVVSCVSALPLGTPAYVGLTLAVNEGAPDDYKGFASRCVVYAMRRFNQDLDKLLLEGDLSSTIARLQHLLRYLALLGKLNIVNGVGDLLQTLVKAAVQAMASSSKEAACALAHMVLSTIPYAYDYLGNTFVLEQLVEPLEANVLSVYTSAYWPGLGKSSLLLKQEQWEGEKEEEEDDEEDDEEEEEEGSSAGQRCDTLQDLFRAVKTLLQEGAMTRFSLLTDAPWLGLVAGNKAEDDEEEKEKAAEESTPLVYTSEPLRLELDCRSISFLLNLANNNNTEDSNIKLQCFDLDGIVYGRLPIFGAPSQEDDDDDDDEDEDEAMETAPNEQLQAYQKGFTLLDRCFLSDAIRDCLFSHKSTVSDSGLERGSAKDTAQQVWAVTHVFSEKQGIEYGIIETLLSLIIQSSSRRHLFVSKVLLELTRLQPSVMPQALVVAVSNLFGDYLPSLVPSARCSLSAWFAFHLTNTDYQWPAGYWELWTPYVVSLKEKKQRNSRGEFVVRTLQLMACNVSSVSTLGANCLPTGSVLAESLVDEEEQIEEDSDDVLSILKDIENRLWDLNEDPDTTRAYMVGDEIAETYSGDSAWWRTCLVLRALLRPAKQQRDGMMRSIQRIREPENGSDDKDDDMMAVEDESTKNDLLTDLTDMLVRYRPVLLATLARDSQDYSEKNQSETKKEESEVLLVGESCLLKQLQVMTSYSPIVVQECITCLLRQRIVSGMAVLHWALGDFGDSPQETKVVKRWWDLAELTLRVGISVEMADSDSAISRSGADIGMVIDNVGDDSSQTEEASSKLMKQLLEYASPLVQYAVRRVCRVLQEMDNQDDKKKDTPVEVDLMEGMKHFVVYTHTLLLSESLKRADGDKSATDLAPSNLNTVLSESDISGENLLSLCRSIEGGSATQDLLQHILERI